MPSPVKPSTAQLAAAIRRLESTVAAKPGDAKNRHTLALLLLEQGRRAEARGHLEAALSARFAPAAFALGRMALDEGDLLRAEQLLRAAASAPALAVDSMFVLAEVLERQGRRNAAANCLEQVIAARPPSPAPYINLFHLLIDSGPARALATADAGIARFAAHANLWLLKGYAEMRSGKPDAAIASLRRALDLAPDDAQATGYLLQSCREAACWDIEAEAFARAKDLLHRMPRRTTMLLPCHAALNFAFSPAELRAIAEDAAAFHARGVTPLPPAMPERKGPLVVGYLSPDYRNHPIAHLVADIFAAHDPERVRAVAFSLGPDDGDPVRHEIATAARPFVDLREMSDRAAAERIRAEGTHILVDLSLYTHHHRPAIPAFRPAPVQTAWLGLPTTTGAPWFDHLLADDIVAPEAHAERYAEALYRLPHGYQPNRRLGAVGRISRAEAGLPEEAMAFACFNAHLKIDRDSFLCWMEVLAAVPGSVLWQLMPPDAIAERWRQAAEAQGIDPQRLIFAPRCDRDRHLARLGCADLMLDSLIYGAHTTCSDALRVGVPMLTVLGDAFAARVGASILTHAGLPELVLPDRDAFIAEAIRLGNDAAARAALREKLARVVPASPVFDPKAQARALEDAYEAIWAAHEKTAAR